MITEDKDFEGWWDVQCDWCSWYTQVEAVGFTEAVAKVKERTSFTIQTDKDGDWEHVCRSCIEKEQTGTVGHNGW